MSALGFETGKLSLQAIKFRCIYFEIWHLQFEISRLYLEKGLKIRQRTKPVESL